MKVYRIWFGCSLGLTLSMLFNWNYGFLAVLLPMFVLSKSPTFKLAFLLMVVVVTIFVTVTTTYIWECTKHHPLLMFSVVAPMMLIYCLAMLKQTTFALGYIGILVGSVIFNLSSYSMFDITDFNINLWIICVCNIAICAIAYFIFPDNPLDNEGDNSKKGNMPEVKVVDVVVVWILVMISFVIFQSTSLYDSASANASIFVILAPMSLLNVVMMAKVRILGTALGCSLGLGAQFIMGVWFDVGILYWLILVIFMGGICSILVKSQAQEAIGYSAMSALTVPLTTVLVPGSNDAVFNTLYRFSSILIAVLVGVIIFLSVHYLFNLADNEKV
ncbi:DUF2955 domain-containing protein [Vibrio sp. 10N.222.51.C12]|uniref:DUF2955 domain-containing protein n=1 Tax=unclassified Vibrio TaxID=2614977 RepID=UPI000C85EF13|nr:DUF2955 domain-containing protein [Vibrio sp. 10N.286.48.B7]PMH77851.1 hypothetical protein BCU58_11485 [Vibrio sp. 10N.286.48.B7]